MRAAKRELRGSRIRQGFTLVELSLSLVFISILSLTIVLMINNAVESYQRGLTLNQINTVGMDLVDDIRAAVQNSSSGEKTGEVSFVKSGKIRINGNDEEVPLSGIFCTGTYTYIWNSGYYYSGEAELGGAVNGKLKYDDNSDVKLLKVKDSGSDNICSRYKDDGWNDSAYGEQVAIGKVLDNNGEAAETVELLGNKDNNLALYSLAVDGPAKGSGASFYSISFILGTLKGGININANNNICKVPQKGGEFNSCAINKFNFAVQATGGKGK